MSVGDFLVTLRDHAASIVVYLGGPAVFIGIAGFFGKRYLDSRLGAERLHIETELQALKDRDAADLEKLKAQNALDLQTLKDALDRRASYESESFQFEFQAYKEITRTGSTLMSAIATLTDLYDYRENPDKEGASKLEYAQQAVAAFNDVSATLQKVRPFIVDGVRDNMKEFLHRCNNEIGVFSYSITQEQSDSPSYNQEDARREARQERTRIREYWDAAESAIRERMITLTTLASRNTISPSSQPNQNSPDSPSK